MGGALPRVNILIRAANIKREVAFCQQISRKVTLAGKGVEPELCRPHPGRRRGYFFTVVILRRNILQVAIPDYFFFFLRVAE